MSRPDAGPARARRVLVAAGQGGVGTTVTAALLALALAERGAPTLLTADGEEGTTLARLFGVPTPTGTATAAVAPGLALGSTAAPVDGTLTLVTTVRAEREALLAAATDLRQAGEEATVMVIAGSGPADQAAAFAAWKLLAPLVPQARWIDLRAPRDLRAEPDALDLLTTATQRFLERAPDRAARIPYDPTLPVALAAGVPLPEAAATSPVGRALGTLVASLAPATLAGAPA